MSLNKSNRLNYILFFATILTTILCGMMMFNGSLLAGIAYSFTVMSIFLIHEMGHYSNAKKHGMEITLPYFIPIPIGIGTMGAFIRMKSMPKDRNALMDTGAAGPLWGFIASIIAVAIGMIFAQAYTHPVPQMFGTSLLYTAMSYVLRGVPPEYLALNPVLFGGWLGFFLTMLNMLPIGQLDGGHVTYALFGKSKNFKRYVQGFFAFFIMWGVFCLFIYHIPTWLFFALLITVFGGSSHPPLDNEMINLTRWNQIKGWACIIAFILTVMPVPFRM
jgi:membrane-associated protease RseP (regulator of RpoE activity)